MALEEIKQQLDKLGNATMNLQHLIKWNQREYEEMKKKFSAYLYNVENFLENFGGYSEQERQRQLGVILHLYEKYKESEE